MRSPLKVAAVQVECTGTLAEIEKRALRMIRRASELGSAIACLPEHWVPGGVRNLSRFLGPFEREARQLGMHIITGGEFVEEAGSTTVESFLIGPRGVVGSQRKVHLFGREKRKAKAGSRYGVFKADGVKVGIAICHDLVYPEVARILVLKGAEVLFSPARIGRAGLPPWQLYVKARALENRVPIVSPNVFDQPRFPGGSMIVGLQDSDVGVVYPRTLARAGPLPRLLIADLDLNQARELRRERLNARRVDTYSPILRAGLDS